MDNHRGRIELLNGLLMSLPGSPVLYYGDELGMGDNVFLRDRDGVRTPMQWSLDRNAGFSRCDPARLYLPVIMDPIYGYQSVNVEAQMNSTASLLHWTRRMIEIRKRHAAFAVGEFTDLGGSNPTMLSYALHYPGDADTPEHWVLCVNNLSRFPQPVELDLREHIGAVPVELTGGTPFPRVGQLPYLLTLPGHGFYWFELIHPSEGGDG
jgi:maltose alpha-D-glucosyltransferase / alpha-amylase